MCVVEEEVRALPRVEGNVGDGCVALQPIPVQPMLLDLPAPGCVFLVRNAELKHLGRSRPRWEGGGRKWLGPARPLIPFCFKWPSGLLF